MALAMTTSISAAGMRITAAVLRRVARPHLLPVRIEESPRQAIRKRWKSSITMNSNSDGLSRDFT